MSLGVWGRVLRPQEDGEGPLYLQSSGVLLSWKWWLGESLSIIASLWKMMAHLGISAHPADICGYYCLLLVNMCTALSPLVGALLWVIYNLKTSSDLPFGTYSLATASLLCPYYRVAHLTSKTTSIIDNQYHQPLSTSLHKANRIFQMTSRLCRSPASLWTDQFWSFLCQNLS